MNTVFLVILFLLGAAYGSCWFFVITYVDNESYYRNIDITKKRLIMLFFHVLFLPFTMWFDRCWRLKK